MEGFSRTGSIVAFDSLWQTPAITEKHAYDRLLSAGLNNAQFGYFAFPWASLIDGVNRGAVLGGYLRNKLLAQPHRNQSYRTLSVCQHVKFRNFIDEFKRAGVTDLYASHAKRGERVIDGINIHPFPLFPVQIPDQAVWQHSIDQQLGEFLSRRYIYSFLGAFDPRFYLTRSRERIFQLPETPRGLVMNRNAWHFEHRVYQEQIHGEEIHESVLSEEERKAQEFKHILRETQFSLCPSGTGPNSIRLWESIEFGCIPVIIADDLRLPGSRQLWEQACVIVEETEAGIGGIPTRLERLSQDRDQLASKLEALSYIRARYGRESFIHDILQQTGSGLSPIVLESQGAKRRHHFYLSVDDDETIVWAWIDWIENVCDALGLKCAIFLDQKLATPTVAPGPRLRSRVRFGSGVFPNSHDWAREDLLTVSDSRTLSRALLKQFNRIHIRCKSMPVATNVGLHDVLSTHCNGSAADRSGVSDLFQTNGNKWCPKCSLITSMHNGDEYVDGFLQNCAELEDYGDYEHFIVRPASPGREHNAVCEHLERNPNVIYIWLHEDPGLYDVWNQCCRLASAPYLSNANIDDRRAPEHVRTLTCLLEDHPDVDVASSALRVTTEKNTTWSDSGSCEVWYANEPSEKYGVDHLLKREQHKILSYNVPHCMPVWRKSIHVWNGYFDEQRFGPSSDWEFWLRAGSAGSRFFIHREALGLYLQSDSSYWRRTATANEYDHRIISTYTSASGEFRGTGGPNQSLSVRLTRMLDSRRHGDSLHYFWCLLELLQGRHGHDPRQPRLLTLLETLCQRDLGIPSSALSRPWIFGSGRAIFSQPRLSQLLRILVDAMHEADLEQSRRSGRLDTWIRALDRLIDLNSAGDALLARAFAAHLDDNRAAELHYLKRAHEVEGKDFWAHLQSAYRFTRPLQELCEDIGGFPPFTQLEEIEPGRTLFFFPDYTHGNPYQKLLYAGLEARGVRTVGVNDLSLLTGATEFEAGDVLHVHWFNILYKGVDPQRHGEVLERFLTQVDELKEFGMRVFWTVHNRYSHDLEDVSLERDFQRRLCRRAELVLLHHPCLIEELSDWLPKDAPIRFLEHGNYIGVYPNQMTQAEGRQKLGLRDDDLVFCVIGQVRPYKGLADILQVLCDAMEQNPRLKLVIAGGISCEATKAQLAAMPMQQVVVHDAFIHAPEFQLYLNAADCVLLSYRAILTSGSLFQAFSYGRPVIAPRLGSLPSYVIPGWNGYLYSDSEPMGLLLRRLLELRALSRRPLGRNAFHTARSLTWPIAPCPAPVTVYSQP